MTIKRLLIPERVYGQPIPVAPDTNAEVDKINELVDAVNAGLATSNAIVGGDKFVRYLSSQTYGVPADALTLDRLDPATILPGVEATVINPHPNPLTGTAPSKYYRATIVPAGTAGAVLVPAFVGSPDTLPITWVEVVDNSSFTPLLKNELNLGKDAYAGLQLRPLLIAIVNGIGTGSSTVISTPAPGQVVTGPTITSFLPATAAIGDSVTLTGTGFTKPTAVLFNGTPATFVPVNATTLVAVVPAGATSGPVAVTNSAGTGTSTASFTVKASVVVTPPTNTKATAPYFGPIDDVNNIVTLGSAYSFTEVRWGVEGQGPQALGSNSICSPGNIAGRLFAYVVADSASNRLQSDTVYSGTFTLAATAPSNNAPTVTLSSPQAGQSITTGDPVVLNADPQDADGSADIKRVEFLDNGVKFTETTVAPHTVQKNITAGAHSFTARVFDMVGASGLSNAVQITGAASQPPAATAKAGLTITSANEDANQLYTTTTVVLSNAVSVATSLVVQFYDSSKAGGSTYSDANKDFQATIVVPAGQSSFVYAANQLRTKKATAYEIGWKILSSSNAAVTLDPVSAQNTFYIQAQNATSSNLPRISVSGNTLAPQNGQVRLAVTLTLDKPFTTDTIIKIQVTVDGETKQQPEQANPGDAPLTVLAGQTVLNLFPPYPYYNQKAYDQNYSLTLRSSADYVAGDKPSLALVIPSNTTTPTPAPTGNFSPGVVTTSQEQFMASRAFTDTARFRQSGLLEPDPAFLIYDGSNGAQLFNDAVVTSRAGATLTKSLDANGRLLLSMDAGGFCFVTFPGTTKALFTCTRVVVSGVTGTGGASYIDAVPGLYTPQATLDFLGAGFRFYGNDPIQNYIGVQGAFGSMVSKTPAPTINVTDEVWYIVHNGDYTIAGIEQADGSVKWGYGTDLFRPDLGVRPATATRLARHRVGIALSSDKAMSLTIKSYKTTYFAAFGAADTHWIRWANATSYVHANFPNLRWATQSAKGAAADGHNTADMSCLRVFTTDITNPNRAASVVNRKLLFVNRNGVIEGDFSAGAMINPANNTFVMNTPKLGGQKDFSTPFTCETITYSADFLLDGEGVHVFTDADRKPLVIDGEQPHDPTCYYIDPATGYWYIMYSVQTGGPTVQRFAKSTDGGLTFHRYDSDYETDPGHADDEGNKIFSYNGQVFGMSSRKHTQTIRIYDLITGKFICTITDPVVQKGLLSQAQQSHLAVIEMPDGTLENWGFETDPPDNPLGAADTSFYPPASDLGAHNYTNGHTRLSRSN